MRESALKPGIASASYRSWALMDQTPLAGLNPAALPSLKSSKYGQGPPPVPDPSRSIWIVWLTPVVNVYTVPSGQRTSTVTSLPCAPSPKCIVSSF